jgi:hypothetical protein
MASDSEIHVGAPVQFRYGVEDVTGVVKEDRGPIGVKGRRLYRIEFSAGPGDESVVELPAAQLLVLHHGVLR